MRGIKGWFLLSLSLAICLMKLGVFVAHIHAGAGFVGSTFNRATNRVLLYFCSLS